MLYLINLGIVYYKKAYMEIHHQALNQMDIAIAIGVHHQTVMYVVVLE